MLLGRVYYSSCLIFKHFLFDKTTIQNLADLHFFSRMFKILQKSKFVRASMNNLPWGDVRSQTNLGPMSSVVLTLSVKKKNIR